MSIVFARGDIALLLSGPFAGQECEVLFGPGILRTQLGELYGYRVAIPAAVTRRMPPMGGSGFGYFADVSELGPLPAANTLTTFDASLWVPEGMEKKP